MKDEKEFKFYFTSESNRHKEWEERSSYNCSKGKFLLETCFLPGLGYIDLFAVNDPEEYPKNIEMRNEFPTSWNRESFARLLAQ